MKKVIVYNKFSVDALFAATFFETQRRFLKDIKSQDSIAIFDNTMILPTDGDEYVWLGIKPVFKATKSFASDVLAQILSTLKFKSLNFKLKRHIETEESNNTILLFDEVREDGVRFSKTITSQVAELNPEVIPGENVMKLTSLIARFHDKKLTISELAFLYINIKKAEEAVAGGDIFMIEEPTDRTELEFLKFIKNVQHQLEHSYRVERIGDRHEYFNVIITNIDSGYHWALRLITFAHKNYANIVASHNGCIIDTNYSDIKKYDLEYQTVLSNAC